LSSTIAVRFLPVIHSLAGELVAIPVLVGFTAYGVHRVLALWASPAARAGRATAEGDVPMSMVVAIGGTGQEVAHFYLLATLLGLANRQGAVKKIAIIDTNNFGPSVQALGAICNQLIAAGTPRIPEVVFARPYEFGDDDTLSRKITGPPSAELPTRSPVRAIFPIERDGVRILDQPLRNGMFYKPMLGPTLDAIEPAAIDDVLTFRDNRATIVGSITGGTLTGFITATLDRLEAEHKYATAILFGRWFVMNQVSGSQQRAATAATYDSNCAGVLTMLSERKNNIAKWVCSMARFTDRRTDISVCRPKTSKVQLIRDWRHAS
jgi:hypothetical protein